MGEYCNKCYVWWNRRDGERLYLNFEWKMWKVLALGEMVGKYSRKVEFGQKGLKEIINCFNKQQRIIWQINSPPWYTDSLSVTELRCKKRVAWQASGPYWNDPQLVGRIALDGSTT